MEGILARGDRRVGKLILRAYENGQIFDGWSEFFRYDVWVKSMEEAAIDGDFYANRLREKDEILPWDFIDIGVKKAYLWKEYEKSKAARTTPDCRKNATVAASKIAKCGVNFMQLRMAFKKTGMIKFISHLDTIRLFNRAIQRAGVPILWSEGFNPHQKLSIAQPLSVGMESEFEVMDMEVEEGANPEKIKAMLNEVLPEGMEIIEATADFDTKSIFERIAKTQYRFFFPRVQYERADELKKMADEAMEQDEILVRRRKKKGKKRIVVEEDIKNGIFSLDWKEEAGAPPFTPSCVQGPTAICGPTAS